MVGTTYKINKCANSTCSKKTEVNIIKVTKSGNIHLSIYRFDEDEGYNIVVSDKYYETYIDFEPEDY